MAKVLVVGGAGYVGSTTSAWLLDAGHEVWVLDDLSTGHPELLLSSNFCKGKAGDVALLKGIFSQHRFDCVMHFAARSLVGESVQKPQEYFENNVHQTQILLETLIEFGMKNFIFSSTCAIFGDPGDRVIDEKLPAHPENPYGETKLEVENTLRSLAQEKGLRAIALRYFNAAGADPRLRVGEWHECETHLIPNVLKAGIADTPVGIFGTDYSTPDGTCIRDYVHIWDLAAAHGAAMERLLGQPKADVGLFETYNLGSEKGYSVREVIQTCEEVLGKKLKVVEKERRPSDPARLVAYSQQARQALGFKTQSHDLKSMISSALEWEKKRSQMATRAVFLDRDGTINEDPGYLNDPGQMKLLPEVGEGLALLKKAGFLLVVVSNQSGVGRGLIRAEVLPKIHERLDELLSPWGVKIDQYRLCFHLPEESCECRKPKPKLILDAARELGILVSQSYMVGDKISDLEAGFTAGCKGSVLVLTGEGKDSRARLEKQNRASFVGTSLVQVANWILGPDQQAE